MYRANDVPQGDGQEAFAPECMVKLGLAVGQEVHKSPPHQYMPFVGLSKQSPAKSTPACKWNDVASESSPTYMFFFPALRQQ